MTDTPGRMSVFVAPTGTPPTAADGWTHVGYAEEFTVETAYEPLPPATEPVEEEQ